MVKFGRHVEAFEANENTGTGLYVVPYNRIKSLITSSATKEETDKFIREWKASLQAASADFEERIGELWKTVFEQISETCSADETRGALPDVALQLYAKSAGKEATQELLSQLVHIQEAALTNTEGLRKLVKKFDKKHASLDSNQQQHHLLTPSLIPFLYAASFNVSLSMLQEGTFLLRTLLEMNGETETTASMMTQQEQPDEDADRVTMIESDIDLHHRTVKGRMEELDWLARLVSSIPHMELSRLVVHRGFHHITDRNDKRPLENSLNAYETAWTNGIHLCECDIALTKDEKLVLAHDEDFSRLALNPSHTSSTKHISDLTFKELIALQLKSGSRPPLLIDVLRSARAISGHAQLIIEIKPGNSATASALSRLLARNPDLMSCVAMIMSFDATTMIRVKKELLLLQQQQHQPNGVPLYNVSSVPTQMSLARLMQTGGDSEAGLNQYYWGSTDGGIGLRTKSSDGIGLSLSQAQFDDPAKLAVTPPEKVSLLQPRMPPTTRGTIPKLMLLTVSQQPQRPCELQVGVEDLSPVESWLCPSDGSTPSQRLDGVYLQFQKEMLEPSGAAALKKLSNERGFLVGVWGHSGQDPDDYNTFHYLVQEGNVTYVNTDLPTSFRQDIRVQRYPSGYATA